MGWNAIILEPAKTILNNAATYLSKVCAILVILIIGWIIAKVVQNVVTRFLKVAQLDIAADKAGITKILTKGDIKHTLAELIGLLVYWLIMLIVVVAAINALNLTVAAQLLNQIVTYVPSVITAVFILAVGMFVAVIAATAVNTVAVNTGVSQAQLLSKLTHTVIVVLAVIMALEQLKIATTTINLVISIVLGAVGLALAIAFGLGSKDEAAKIVKRTLDNLK